MIKNQKNSCLKREFKLDKYIFFVLTIFEFLEAGTLKRVRVSFELQVAKCEINRLGTTKTEQELSQVEESLELALSRNAHHFIRIGRLT